MVKRVLTAAAVAAVVASAQAQELSEEERAAIAARLAPVGKVCLQGENCAGIPERVVAALPEVHSDEDAVHGSVAAQDDEADVAPGESGDMVADAEDDSAAAEGLAAAVSDTMERASDSVETAADNAANLIAETTGSASDAVEAAADNAEDVIAGTTGSAADTVQSMAGDAADAIAEAADSVAEGIETAVASVTGAATADASAVVATAEGEATYNGACLACHAYGAAGAPIVGNVEAWAPRIAKGMDALYTSGLNGVAGTGMIAKGGRPDLSDDAVKAAVDYMVANSR